MANRIKFDDLKDKENLVYFLRQVWKVGCMSALLNKNLTYQQLEEKFMPDFKKELE